MFSLFIFIPVVTIPGNDLIFQISLLTYREYSLFILLSILTALSIILQLYIYRINKSRKIGISIFGQGIVGVFSAFLASILGASTCAACLSFVFGLLGVGGFFFLLEYRNEITLFAVIILMLSIYFSSKRIMEDCEVCRW